MLVSYGSQDSRIQVIQIIMKQESQSIDQFWVDPDWIITTISYCDSCNDGEEMLNQLLIDLSTGWESGDQEVTINDQLIDQSAAFFFLLFQGHGLRIWEDMNWEDHRLASVVVFCAGYDAVVRETRTVGTVSTGKEKQCKSLIAVPQMSDRFSHIHTQTDRQTVVKHGNHTPYAPLDKWDPFSEWTRYRFLFTCHVNSVKVKCDSKLWRTNERFIRNSSEMNEWHMVVGDALLWLL